MNELRQWADDIVNRFPTSSNQDAEDEWYGVENGVDVLWLAIEIQRLLAIIDKGISNERTSNKSII